MRNIILLSIFGCLLAMYCQILITNAEQMAKLNELKTELKALKSFRPEPNFSERYYMHRLTEPKPSVETQIRDIARRLNFRWPNYLVKLAFCESGLDPLAVNTTGNYPAGSRDLGLYQINDYWHNVSDDCAFDVVCATEWTINRINAGYQQEWVCNDKILAKN